MFFRKNSNDFGNSASQSIHVFYFVYIAKIHIPDENIVSGIHFFAVSQTVL